VIGVGSGNTAWDQHQRRAGTLSELGLFNIAAHMLCGHYQLLGLCAWRTQLHLGTPGLYEVCREALGLYRTLFQCEYLAF
jgi:hypothetical protein